MNSNELKDKLISVLEEKIQILQEQKEILYEIVEIQKRLLSRKN